MLAILLFHETELVERGAGISSWSSCPAPVWSWTEGPVPKLAVPTDTVSALIPTVSGGDSR
jgi:hypothetical protein